MAKTLDTLRLDDIGIGVLTLIHYGGVSACIEATNKDNADFVEVQLNVENAIKLRDWLSRYIATQTAGRMRDE